MLQLHLDETLEAILCVDDFVPFGLEQNGQQILDLTQLCVTLDGIRSDDGEKD